MKALLKKIEAINAKYWGLSLPYDPTIYKKQYQEYMDELEAAIQAYTISPCDCKEDETTGCITEDVCNNCGRAQKA